MPMITCDEPIDVSFLGSGYARDLSEAIACTRYGEVRRALDERVSDCLMAELCEDDRDRADPVGASIFDHDSSMGLGLDETEDHWVRDVPAGTWTRVIVVPRKSTFHPSEGEGGPDVGTLSGKRSTIPLSVETICDNWKSAGCDETLLGEKLWTGRCVFRESWDDLSSGAATDPIASVAK
jgi:hypothetical protein